MAYVDRNVWWLWMTGEFLMPLLWQDYGDQA